MKNPKAKGSQFEREICKLLTKWVTGKEKPVIFWRIGSSGAQATLSNSNKMVGDIVAVDEKGLFLTNMFTIELKVTKNFNLIDVFNEKNKFWKWWQQVERDSQKVVNYPLLIFKVNRKNIYAVFEKVIFNIVDDYCGKPEFMYFLLHKNRRKYVICRLVDFLDYLESWKDESEGGVKCM